MSVVRHRCLATRGSTVGDIVGTGWMKIREVNDCAYATDGGSVWVSFTDGDGRDRELAVVQDLIPIDARREPNPHWRSGAILLDGEPVTDQERLRGLGAALRVHVARMPERPNRVPIPENTVVVGDDLMDYLTRDPEGRRRWLLREAARRIEAKASDAGD
jgi:hypothetical protein